MKMIVFIAIILLVLLVVYGVIAYTIMQAKKVKYKKPNGTGKWTVVLEDRHTITEAWLCQDGDPVEYFGGVDRLTDGYADRLISLEVAAEDRARERNIARKVVGQ